MTDRTDHAAEAHRLLVRSAQFNEPDNAELSVDIAAQAHATLALVEQQRIANLIALNKCWEQTAHTALDSVAPVLRPDIAAALGIETSQ